MLGYVDRATADQLVLEAHVRLLEEIRPSGVTYTPTPDDPYKPNDSYR